MPSIFAIAIEAGNEIKEVYVRIVFTLFKNAVKLKIYKDTMPLCEGLPKEPSSSITFPWHAAVSVRSRQLLQDGGKERGKGEGGTKIGS